MIWCFVLVAYCLLFLITYVVIPTNDHFFRFMAALGWPLCLPGLGLYRLGEFLREDIPRTLARRARERADRIASVPPAPLRDRSYRDPPEAA